jgi:hypothetical protein
MVKFPSKERLAPAVLMIYIMTTVHARYAQRVKFRADRGAEPVKPQQALQGTNALHVRMVKLLMVMERV